MVQFSPSVFTLALSLAVLPPLALAEDARPLTKADAMVVIDDTTPAPQLGPLGVTCDDGRRVGIWLESPESFVLRYSYIRHCDVGIMIAPSPGVNHTVSSIRLRKTRIGIWNRGDGTRIENNSIWDSEYGLVLSGNHAVVFSNGISDVAKDGLTVVGHGNTIVSNWIRKSGRYGLNVIGEAPQLNKHESLLGLRDDPAGNHIEGNIIEDSGEKDLRQWPIRCADNPPRNTFLRNTFDTKNANCLE